MRSAITFFILIFTLCACNKTAPPVRPNTTNNTNVQPKETSQANADIPELEIIVNGEQISNSGDKYSSNESAEIIYPTNSYTYTWQRRGDNVSLLGEYTLSNDDQDNAKFLSLKSITQNTDWFVISSSQPLGISKNKMLTFAKTIQAPTHTSSIKPYTWRVYTVAPDLQKSQLQGSVDVFHSSFSLEIMSKQKGSSLFEPHRQQKLTVGNTVKLKLKVFEPTHLAIFLCSVAADTVTSVSQIFPDNSKEPQTNEVSTGIQWEKVISDVVKSGEENNEHWLYCFEQKQPLNTDEVKRWLSTKVRGFDAVVSLTTGEVTTAKDKEETLGATNNIVKVEEKDFPHIKIGLKTN